MQPHHMVSRRDGLKLAASAVALGGSAAARAAEAPEAAPTVKTPVDFAVPPGACDCHVHVFPDPAKFPFWSGRSYSPPVATADDLLALQKALRMDHVVIVTPSVYGADNAATLDGMRQLGPQRARGVAVIDSKTSTSDLDAMHRAGVRGIRGSSIPKPRPGGWTRPCSRSRDGPGTCRCTPGFRSSRR